MQKVRIRVDCRFCQGNLKQVFSLSPTPIANSFPKEPNTGEFYPLDLMECQNCGHVQLRHVLDKASLFVDYNYQTPEAFIPHLKELAWMLRERYPHHRRLLEIGCNNGHFMDEAFKEGFDTIGIDPNMDITRHRGYRRFFDESISTIIGKVDVIVAINTFAHIDDLDSVFRGIDQCLSEQGVVVFEVQSLPHMAEKGLFDMIYHEHLDYHTAYPWKGFLERYGLTLCNVEIIPTQGGSLRMTAQRKTDTLRLPPKPVKIDWNSFQYRVEQAKNKALYHARLCKQKGRKLVAFGAAAKACTSIHHFGIKDYIAYCVDDARNKWHHYIPGTDIEIFPASQFEIEPPDLVILTAWNYESLFRTRFPDLEYLNPYE